MADEKFKCGDVVRLRSGGPSMTVMTADRGDGIAECRWFVGDDVRGEAFDHAELILAATGVGVRAIWWTPFADRPPSPVYSDYRDWMNG